MMNTLQAQAWRILHIDDDDDDRLLVRMMLGEARGQAISLDCAATFDEGWEKLSTNYYHAVLVDYDLGARSGIELIRAFTSRGYDAPMILLTGRGSYEVDVEAMHAGATLYLTKSEINALLLERFIRYAIERKQVETELRRSSEALSERDRLLNVALEATHLASWTVHYDSGFVDLDTRAQQIYRASQPRENHEKLLGRVLDPDDLPLARAAHENATDPNGSGEYRVNYRIMQEDGSKRWISASGLVEFEGEGSHRRAVRLVGASRDITAEKLSQQSLRESEARFRDLANNISQLAWMANPNGSIFWYNQRWFDYTGSTFEEMAGFGWQKAHHPTYADAVKEKYLRAFASGETWEDTFPLRGKDGQYRWFLSRAVPIKDDDGNVIRWFGTNTDITEQQKLQEENWQQKDLLERLLQSAPVGIAFLKGSRHIYTLVNNEYRLYARGKGELIGSTVAEIWPEIAEAVIPQMDRVFQTGEPFSIINTPLTIVRDGVPENDYFSYTFTPIYKADGSIEGVMIVAIDTTNAVNNQQAVEAQSARLEAVLHSLPLGVWIADADGRMIGKNEQANRIWAGEAPLSTSFSEYQVYKARWPNTGAPVQPDEWPLTRAITHGEQSFGVEVEIERFDGTRATVLISASPVVDRAGNRTGGVAALLDISARKQIEEALQQSERNYRALTETLEIERAKLAAAIENLPVGISISDAEGNLVLMNQAGLRLHGVPSRDNLPARIQQYGEAFELYTLDGTRLPPDQRPSARAMRGDYVQDLDLWMVNRITGQKTPLRHSAFPVANSQGKTVLIVYVMMDMSESQQAIDLLESSRAQLRAVLDNLADGVLIVDFSGATLDLNEKAVRLLGHANPRDALRSLPENEQIFDILTLDGQSMDLSDWPISRLVRGETFEGVEARVRRKDTGHEWVGSFNGKPIPGPSGPMTTGVFTMRDITREKWAQEALRASEERYRFAARATSDAIWDWDLTTDAIGWNDALIEQFGYSPSEQKSSSGTWWTEHIHPEDRAAVSGSLQQAIHGSGETWTYEYRFQRSDGSYAEVHNRGWVIRDKKGRPTRMIGAMRDITEQKKAGRAMSESEARFRLLADSMPQAVWTASPDGVIDYFNQRKEDFSGLSAGSGEQWSWYPAIHPDEHEATERAWTRARETKTVFQIEHRALMVSGEYRWHLSRAVPALGEDGEVVKWFGTSTDIHELKQAEAALEDYAARLKRSNEELERFAFVASHDLQEPLRKIRMFGEGLLRFLHTQQVDAAEDYINRMQNAAIRMQSMIDGLLDLSRISTRGKPFIRLRLNEVADEVVSDLEPRIRASGGQVEVGPLPTVRGDALQLHQLLQNLIGNALKFHHPSKPPRVRVTGESVRAGDKQEARIVVEDDGIGFDESYAGEIFRPFVRLHGRADFEGSGMGLAICQKIVERHGGSIQAASRVGEGSRFTIILPG